MFGFYLVYWKECRWLVSCEKLLEIEVVFCLLKRNNVFVRAQGGRGKSQSASPRRAASPPAPLAPAPKVILIPFSLLPNDVPN